MKKLFSGLSGALSIILAVLLAQGCARGSRENEADLEYWEPNFAYSINETDLSDLEFAIKDVETNYSGFSFKVTDENRADYDAFVKSVRKQLSRGRIDEFEAVAKYLGYFQDSHLQTCNNGCNDHHRKYRKQGVDYGAEMTYAPVAVATKVSDKTFLIRYPSCSAGEVSSAWVRGSVDQFLASGCDNLILDIRGNNGGSDDMYTPYLWLLYDHPGTVDGVMLLDTKENRRIFEDYCPTLYEGAPISRESEPSGGFVTLFGETNDVGLWDDRSPKPVKAAIIIDNRVVSSGEQLLLDVRACSDRCTIYGKDNTRGCLDFSNCRLVRLSGICHYYQVPMTVSRRVLNGTGIDETGIAPDVRVDWNLPKTLTDNIDSWVVNIAAELEKNDDSQ